MYGMKEKNGTETLAVSMEATSSGEAAATWRTSERRGPSEMEARGLNPFAVSWTSAMRDLEEAAAAQRRGMPAHPSNISYPWVHGGNQYEGGEVPHDQQPAFPARGMRGSGFLQQSGLMTTHTPYPVFIAQQSQHAPHIVPYYDELENVPEGSQQAHHQHHHHHQMQRQQQQQQQQQQQMRGYALPQEGAMMMMASHPSYQWVPAPCNPSTYQSSQSWANQAPYQHHSQTEASRGPRKRDGVEKKGLSTTTTSAALPGNALGLISMHQRPDPKRLAEHIRDQNSLSKENAAQRIRRDC